MYIFFFLLSGNWLDININSFQKEKKVFALLADRSKVTFCYDMRTWPRFKSTSSTWKRNLFLPQAVRFTDLHLLSRFIYIYIFFFYW